MINGQDIRENFESTYVNQQGLKINKIGQIRLRALELIQLMLSLMHPSNGPLAAA
jgi:hypothetical protein